jgi:UDP-N-acetylglucosamine--N-acetylmuramyl-(pentapeptide) pyrophosphoryl-undecaprenol N-acetylglucosamine transferase
MGSIVMTGGGTGGHLAIVRAVKEELKGRELVYIGSVGGQDRQWFGEDDDFTARYFLETRGVVNQGALGKVRSLGMLAKAIRRSMTLLDEHDARVVFSVGGYSAAQAAIAAILKKIPLVIQLHIAVPGTLNRTLVPYANALLSS